MFTWSKIEPKTVSSKLNRLTSRQNGGSLCGKCRILLNIFKMYESSSRRAIIPHDEQDYKRNEVTCQNPLESLNVEFLEVKAVVFYRFHQWFDSLTVPGFFSTLIFVEIRHRSVVKSTGAVALRPLKILRQAPCVAEISTLRSHRTNYLSVQKYMLCKESILTRREWFVANFSNNVNKYNFFEPKKRLDKYFRNWINIGRIVEQRLLTRLV